MIVKEYDYCKKIVKEHFNKYLIMSVENEKTFRLSNKCGDVINCLLMKIEN